MLAGGVLLSVTAVIVVVAQEMARRSTARARVNARPWVRVEA
jgi:hypothetical protein